MRYRITHKTHYRYSAPVRLRKHVLRLCPRSDGNQWLEAFELHLRPAPARQSYFLDAQGNTCLAVSFAEPLDAWSIQAVSDVRTTRENPFDYLAEPWAVQLPVDYPSSVVTQLSPYLREPAGWPVSGAIAPAIVDLAESLQQEVNGNVSFFLTRLAQFIPDRCQYQQRLEGAPQTPALTLAKQSGTCRDFAVLYVAVCRAVGLAARFVSGYQEGDLDAQNHDLHAWAEVYVPGGGWRGFDPTLGLAASDRHVAIAAAADFRQAAPVSGTLQPGSTVETTLESQIHLSHQSS